MWKLVYPLRYFFLRNKEKSALDKWATLIVALVISLPFILLPGTNFFHPNGFLDRLLTLTAALTGFYVAALVAAATFSHPDLDKTIKSGPVALVTKDLDGNKVTDWLTRRELACAIFGYLAFSSFFLSIIESFFVGMSSFDPKIYHVKYISVVLSNKNIKIVRDILLFIVSGAVGHLAVGTCIGLYYLMDRLYRRDRKITTRKPGAAMPQNETDAA